MGYFPLPELKGKSNRIVRKNHLQDPNHIEVGQKLYY